MKKLLSALALGFVSFIVTFTFFSKKSFYPYNINFVMKSSLDAYIEPKEIEPYFSSPFLNLQKGTVFIDSVIKESDASIRFLGRYYTDDPISMPQLNSFLTEIVRESVSKYLGNQYCSVTIDINKADIPGQIASLAVSKPACASLVRAEYEKTAAITGLGTADAGRTKKIIFVSLVISVFLAFATFVVYDSGIMRHE